MKCHYVYDEVSRQKILISCCYGTMHSDDIRDCDCSDDEFNYSKFEKELYNKRVKELKDELKSMDYLYKEVQRLNKRVEYWHKKYLTLKNKVSEQQK
jgi:hypothetical protein|nr:MAG TPA: hypothetical protein [Caudoviricetes sp.]